MPIHSAVETQLPKGENEFTTKTGKVIRLKESHPEGASLSDLKISAEGFKDNKPIELSGIDPVQSMSLADLNENGFDEIYVFTAAAGSGSAGSVYGYESEKDERLAEIKFPSVATADMQQGGLFEGYMGHDSMYIAGTYLERTFPVYKEKDANCCPTGGSRTIKYLLKNHSLVVAEDSSAVQEITRLIREALTWADDKSKTIELLPAVANRDSICTGFDMVKLKSNIEKLKETGFFSNEFIENYNRIILTLDKKIKDKEFDEWNVYELPVFRFANDANPWCLCQDVPYDKPNPWQLVEVKVVSLNNESGEFIWKWGKPELNQDGGWKRFTYKFRVAKEDGKWKIAYMQGFDFNEGTAWD